MWVYTGPWVGNWMGSLGQLSMTSQSSQTHDVAKSGFQEAIPCNGPAQGQAGATLSLLMYPSRPLRPHGQVHQQRRPPPPQACNITPLFTSLRFPRALC